MPKSNQDNKTSEPLVKLYWCWQRFLNKKKCKAYKACKAYIEKAYSFQMQWLTYIT